MNKSLSLSMVVAAASAAQLKQSPAAIEHMLAQVAQDSSISHSCSFSADRSKLTLPDRDSILGSGADFVDETFPFGDALFWPADGEWNSSMNSYYSNGYWKRASTTFPTATLWGSENITPEDIRQGALGNCWFMSAASALAEFPGRVENVIEDDAVNEEGIYAINFWTLGVPHTVIVDDYLPIAGTRTIFANIGFDNSLWMPILEKAFAKLMGNYLHIEGGWMRMGLHYLNGSPYETLWHNSIGKEDLWDRMVATDTANDIIQSATHFASGGHDWQNANGLAYSHAYTLLGTHTLSTGTRLLRMRNPWGSEGYSGPWSDSSSEWDSAAGLRDEVPDYGFDNDGVFYIDLDTYYTDFQVTEFNLDTRDMYNSSFLKLNDDTAKDGQYSSDNRRHELTITSTV